MRPTKRFLLAIMVGGLVAVAMWPLGFHSIVFLLWNILLIGLFVLDILLTPNAECVQLQRASGGTLYYNIENNITFHVTNISTYELQIALLDEAHMHFRVVDKSRMVGRVMPGEKQVFLYSVVPIKRGSFFLGAVYLYYAGVLGLCARHTRLEHPAKLNVYPNIKGLGKYRLMAQKKRLLPHDEKPIRIIGTGGEFESLRPYVDCDDYRMINWSASARNPSASARNPSASARNPATIVNQHTAEGQPTYILLDMGRSMAIETGGMSKLDYTIAAALALADVINKNGGRVGLMAFDSKVRVHIPPGRGAAHSAKLLEAVYALQSARLTVDYFSAFRTLCKHQSRHSLVFIFTDFELSDDANRLTTHMAWLKKNHTPIAVFMKSGQFNMLTKITPNDPYANILQKAAEDFMNVASERKRVFAKLTAMGIANVETRAEDFSAAAISRYIRLVRT